jgi:alkylation response protein AidB-like acyl-CoA dehydrogenase
MEASPYKFKTIYNHRTYRNAFVNACLGHAPAEALEWLYKLEDVTENIIRRHGPLVDVQGTYPQHAVEALKEIGAFGVLAPKLYGGLGFGKPMAALAVETVAGACPSTAAILMFHYQVVNRVIDFGTKKQKETDLPELASGKCLGGSAWSELEAGADKSNILTRLENRSGRQVVNGEKNFCTGLEGLGIIHVLLGVPQNGNGIAPTFVSVRANARGVKLSPIQNLMGLRGSSTGSVTLDEVDVSEDDIIDSIGTGMKLMRCNHEFLMNPGLIALGISRAMYEEAKQAVTGKWNGMRDTTTYQNTRFGIADIEVKISTAYALATQTVEYIEQGMEDIHLECLKFKIHATTTVTDISSMVLQLVGARGFVGDWPIEKLFRDARATLLMGPSNEVIKEWIAGKITANLK